VLEGLGVPALGAASLQPVLLPLPGFPPCCSVDMLEFSGGEGPCSMLKWKSKADLSSKGQKSFICREEKGKAPWGRAVGTGNQWSTESGWKLGYIAFYCPRTEILAGRMLKERCLCGVNRCFLGRRRGILPLANCHLLGTCGPPTVWPSLYHLISTSLIASIKTLI
jgi:hypothetical protein